MKVFICCLFTIITVPRCSSIIHCAYPNPFKLDVEIKNNLTTFYENKTSDSKVEIKTAIIFVDIMDQFILVNDSNKNTLYSLIQTIEFDGETSKCSDFENTLMFSKLNMLFDEMTNLLESECDQPKNLLKNFQFQEDVEENVGNSKAINRIQKLQIYSFNKFGDIDLIRHTVNTVRVENHSARLSSVYEAIYKFPNSAIKIPKSVFKVRPANKCQKLVF